MNGIPQIVAVKALMETGDWRTLQGLKDSCFTVFGVGISETAVSARLRDLRKSAYGAHTIVRRKTARRGIYEYRLVPQEGAS